MSNLDELAARATTLRSIAHETPQRFENASALHLGTLLALSRGCKDGPEVLFDRSLPIPSGEVAEIDWDGDAGRPRVTLTGGMQSSARSRWLRDGAVSEGVAADARSADEQLALGRYEQFLSVYPGLAEAHRLARSASQVHLRLSTDHPVRRMADAVRLRLGIADDDARFDDPMLLRWAWAAWIGSGPALAEALAEMLHCDVDVVRNDDALRDGYSDPVHIRLGPLQWTQYVSLLPVGDAALLRATLNLARFVAGAARTFDVTLVLCRDQVWASSDRSVGLPGWTWFLRRGSRPPTRNPRVLIPANRCNAVLNRPNSPGGRII